MVKIMGAGMEPVSDIYKYQFIKKGMRGEISYIAKRRSKANNEHDIIWRE